MLGFSLLVSKYGRDYERRENVYLIYSYTTFNVYEVETYLETRAKVLNVLGNEV